MMQLDIYISYINYGWGNPEPRPGQVAEDIEARGHLAIFYPKFHCKLDFIERFWCSCKRHAREQCTSSLPGLHGVVPTSLRSVPVQTIRRYYMHCKRTIDAYLCGYRYGTQMFTERVRHQHRAATDPDQILTPHK